MHKIIIALVIGLFIGYGGPAAAQQDAQQDVQMQRMALMQERDALLLETVQLLKTVVKDRESKAKAESLERRIQANIEKHNKMHAMMMSGHAGMAGMGSHKAGCGGGGEGCCGGAGCGGDAGCCGGKDNPCPMKDNAPADKKTN